MLHVLKELKVLSNQSITISAEVREGGPGYMKNFIKHSDAQLILSFLDLPLMGATDSVRALMGQPHQTGAIAVDDADDDIVVLDDVSGNANSAHARHPLAPLDMNAGRGVIQDTQSQNYQNTIHVDDGTAENGSRGQNLQAAAADLQIARCPSGSDFAAEGSRRFTVKRLKSLEQKDYENMSHAQCSLAASKASKALAAQAARADEALKQLRVLKRIQKAQDLANQKRQRTQDATTGSSCLEIVSLGKMGRRIDVKSCFAVGIRRNYVKHRGV